MLLNVSFLACSFSCRLDFSLESALFFLGSLPEQRLVITELFLYILHIGMHTYIHACGSVMICASVL